MKRIIFEAPPPALAKWYTVIGSTFYVWSKSRKAWVTSINEPGKNERRLRKAMANGKVYKVKLKGKIIHD